MRKLFFLMLLVVAIRSATGAGFVHVADAKNSAANSTFLSDPSIDGRADAMILVTPNLTAGRQTPLIQSAPIGVWFDANRKRWAIFNQDKSPVTLGVAFNVEIVTAPEAFVHTATAKTVVNNYTLIDHPILNGSPDAPPIITANWNPMGKGGIYNPHPIGVWYVGDQKRWAIFNQDLAPMAENASFNVAVGKTVLQTDTELKASGDPSFLLQASAIWNPGGKDGVYNPHTIGVWLDPSVKQWRVINQDKSPIPLGAAFAVRFTASQIASRPTTQPGGNGTDFRAEIPAERIAHAYHGMLLDKNMREIKLDNLSVAEMQDSMIHELMKESDPTVRRRYGLVFDKAELWAKLEGNAKAMAKNGIIEQLLDQAWEPFKSAYQWRQRLMKPWISTLQVSPDTVDLLRTNKLLSNDLKLKGGTLDYAAACRIQGVPIPPDWPSAQWVWSGDLNPPLTFAGRTQAHVYTFNDTAEATNGVCYALPREPENDLPPLMGIICQSQRTGKACFWDNLDATTELRMDWRSGAPQIVIANIMNGSNLHENCTTCHRGKNAFLIHPSTALQVTGLVTDPAIRYSPVGQSHWSNPPPLLEHNPAAPGCSNCHEIPEPRSTTNGYCNVLAQSAMRTMPPTGAPAGWPAPVGSPFNVHTEFLRRHCGLPGSTASSSLSITFPVRESVIASSLASIAGTVSLAQREVIREVRIAIRRQESDEEWAYDATRRIYRWMTGPTGQWLSTRLAGETWSAPSTAYTLPAERDLPNGSYVIYAYLVTTSGARSEQIRRTFTIAR